MIPKRANSLAVVEGVLSRFFQPTAAERAIGHVCQARFVVQAAKGQRIPNKSPGERELGVVQEARSWRPIPMRADLLRRPAMPLAERIRSGTHPIQFFPRPWKVTGPKRVTKGLSALADKVLRPKAEGLSWSEEKSDSPFVSTLRPPSRIGPGMQVFQQASGSSDQAYLDPRCVYVGCRPAIDQSYLERDRWSANRRGLGRGSTDNR